MPERVRRRSRSRAADRELRAPVQARRADGRVLIDALLAVLPDDTTLSLEVPTGGQVPIERH